MNRNAFLKSAVMLCVLVFVSIGCGDSSAQSANQDGSRLVGTWIDARRGYEWVFRPDGTGAWDNNDMKYGAINGKMVMVDGIGGYSYEYVISNNGKTALLCSNASTYHSHLLQKKQ